MVNFRRGAPRDPLFGRWGIQHKEKDGEGKDETGAMGGQVD